MLIDAGWHLNDKQVERLWRREGLKVPMKQPMRSRLWLNDGSCIRLRPQHVDRVWSYDFVYHRRVQPRVSGDQSEEKAQFDGCDRRFDGLIHRSRCFNLQPLRQWAGVYCSSCQAMDQGRRRKDRLYRARVTLGERLLRELKRPFQGRTLK